VLRSPAALAFSFVLVCIRFVFLDMVRSFSLNEIRVQSRVLKRWMIFDIAGYYRWLEQKPAESGMYQVFWKAHDLCGEHA
jgi:hypothetical protein